MVKINGTEIGTETFPNNERIFKTDNIKVEGYAYFYIDMNYETDSDILKLIMAKKYLDDKYRNPTVVLTMKYIPYSRMDRKIDGFMFTLKYFCQIINDLNFFKVIVLDPHSNVSSALLDRCEEINVNNVVEAVINEYPDKIDYIFYPDNGAYKRYSEILDTDIPTFFGNKKRNLQSGLIEEYQLIDPPKLNGETILIIDDLCSRGGTFCYAGKELKKVGAGDILLYVSHCENTIYNGVILKTDYIDNIYTTDSILKNWKNDKIINVSRYV